MTPGDRRWSVALRRVRALERRSALLPATRRRRDWQVLGRTAWRDGADLTELPRGVRPSGGPDRLVRTACAADLVTVGKFDVEREVRLRAFYPGRGLSVRHQRGGRDSAVARTVAAYQAVAVHAPGLMPAVLEHGSIRRRAAYLVEETVTGRHPVGARQLQDLLLPLTTRLHALHQGVGTVSHRLSGCAHPRLPERWATFVAASGIGPKLDRAVRRLVGRDALLEVSLGHGDLVASNIVLAEDRVVLVDWEYAGPQPVAFDLAKVQLHCADPQGALEAVDAGTGRTLGRGRDHYPLAEQLALAHVQMLSWHGVREDKARAAGRTAFLERATASRAAAVASLLGVD